MPRARTWSSGSEAPCRQRECASSVQSCFKTQQPALSSGAPPATQPRPAQGSSAGGQVLLSKCLPARGHRPPSACPPFSALGLTLCTLLRAARLTASIHPQEKSPRPPREHFCKKKGTVGSLALPSLVARCGGCFHRSSPGTPCPQHQVRTIVAQHGWALLRGSFHDCGTWKGPCRGRGSPMAGCNPAGSACTRLLGWALPKDGACRGFGALRRPTDPGRWPREEESLGGDQRRQLLPGRLAASSPLSATLFTCSLARSQAK